jgi:hypothetical protein
MATWSSFFGYSMTVFTTSDLSPISPATSVAAGVSYGELLCGLVAGVILVFTILTAARDKYRQDIKLFVDELRLAANATTARVSELFQLTLEEVEYILIIDQSHLVNRLRKLRDLPELLPPTEEQTEPAAESHISSTEKIVD